MVVKLSSDGITTSSSYARYLMETHLGRNLESWETVDHIDGDKTNDVIENFQILTIEENVRKYIEQAEIRKELYKFECPICGIVSIKEMRNVRSNWKKGRVGPFCSRSCSGTFNALNQYSYNGQPTQTD